MTQITLKAKVNDRYVLAEHAGSSPLIANATKVGPWELFELSYLSGNFIYNVKDYGAKGDGVNDDASAIQKAINEADQQNGGTVFFPPGRYLIKRTIELKEVVHLLGSGWSSNHTGRGTFIYVESDFAGDQINVIGRSSSISRIGFACEQPALANSWSPNNFGNGAAIHVRADDVLLSDILLYNVTRGIDCSNATGSIGRVTMNRIYGQPIKEGIIIDNALDVMKVSNVHFWPFWSGDKNVMDYMASHAVGLISFRNDNPFYSDIFCLGYRWGMKFSASSNPGGDGVDPVIWGKTSKFKLTNIDLDFCGIALYIDGNNTTGTLSNFSCQGPDPGRPSYEGITIDAEDVRVHGTDIQIANYSSNGVRVSGKNTLAMFNSVWINDWNTSKKGFPAIEAVNKETVIRVGNLHFMSNGNGAASFGGQGSVSISQSSTV